MSAEIKNCIARVLAIESFGLNYKKLVFHDHELAAIMKPGQFINIRVGNSADPLLRRPMSIHQIDRENSTFSLLFQVVGKGTKIMDSLKVGDEVEILAPLGLEFPLPSKELGQLKIALLAGGIGIAPLLALAQELTLLGHRCTLFFGARTNGDFAVLQSFRDLGIDIITTTEDGSCGHQGYITQNLKAEILAQGFNRAYACGPTPMLKALQQELAGLNLDLWFSLEAHMACGMGVCLGCTVKVRDPNGNTRLALLCKEGPVIKAEEVVFGD